MARRRIGFDRSAYAFAVAARLADATQIRAVNALTIGTKFDGIWPLVQVLYPFAGGTASAHSLNLKNTGANRITWFGSLVHSVAGVKGDGATGYGSTAINPTTLGPTFHHAVAYSDNIGGSPLYGSYIDNAFPFAGCTYYPTHPSGVLIRVGTGHNNVSATPRPSGVSIASRINSSQFIDYHNGQSSLIGSNFIAHTSATLTLLAVSAGGSINPFGEGTLRSFSAGSALNSSQVAQLAARIADYNQALGRAVVP